MKFKTGLFPKIFVSAVLVGFVLFVVLYRKKTEYVTYQSPDQRFKVVVCRYQQYGIMMPGQSGDAPGVVFVVDNANGRVLGKKRIEMVQMVNVNQIEWSPTNVYIHLIGDWKLPEVKSP
ncbi:MAG TPA: hypothetical protein VM680_07915 [Verrucomicrobiae bacterium]|nr:hypothetical protein [Verrucomicrobiae bacterium]